jgi:hypothetical protein
MADTTTTTTTTKTLKDLPEKPENPKGSFEGFTEHISSEGKIFYSAAVDDNGKPIEQPAEEKGGSSLEGAWGPKVPCYWAYDTAGSTEPDVADKLGVVLYSLDHWLGATYKLTFKSNKRGWFRFNSQADKYDVQVVFTSSHHWVFMTTNDPNIVSVQYWS